jgi:hypothetical protein
MGLFSFDDQKVQMYVNKALAENVHQKSYEHRLLGAFGSLYAQRGREDPNDENLELAAAEHYMYARYQVYSGETQATVMEMLTVGYDAMKVLSYLPLFYLFRRFIVKHSWTRPSTDIIRWGLKGCQDGEANRRIIPEGAER